MDRTTIYTSNYSSPGHQWWNCVSSVWDWLRRGSLLRHVRRLDNFALLRARTSTDAVLPSSGGLGLHEWPVALGFLESHEDETSYYKDPVDVVGNDRAVGGGVLPTENGVEDTPAAVAGGSG